MKRRAIVSVGLIGLIAMGVAFGAARRAVIALPGRASYVAPIPNAVPGLLKSGSWTVSSTVISIAVPTGASGFSLRPATNAIRYAVDEDPAALGSAALAAGATALADATTTRSLPVGATTLRVVRVSGDAVTYAEFY